MDSLRAADSANGFVDAHLRRNFVALAMDYGFFGLGMSFASTATILPALAERLQASNLIIGALPFLVLLGRSAPALFSARLIEPLPRKLPFVLTYTPWERLPWLALALAVYFLGESNPGLVLMLLVGVLALVSLVGGSLSPAWTDLVGKVIPTSYRGRFFALGGAFSTGLGLLGAAASGYVLQEYAFPTGYALCLGAAFLCLVASYASMAMAREPAIGTGGHPLHLRVHMARLPQILRANRSFGWYLVAQALRVFGTMAFGFYAVYALRFLEAREWNVAGFTFVLLAAQAAAGLALGALADREGHRASLLVGMIAAASASALAVLAGDLVLYHGVFLLAGVGMAANNISSQNLVLELSGREERPTYLGLASTSQAPFALVAPLLAASLADGIGLPAVFVAAGMASTASAAVYLFRVEEPRGRLVG